MRRPPQWAVFDNPMRELIQQKSEPTLRELQAGLSVQTLCTTLQRLRLTIKSLHRHRSDGTTGCRRSHQRRTVPQIGSRLPQLLQALWTPPHASQMRSERGDAREQLYGGHPKTLQLPTLSQKPPSAAARSRDAAAFRRVDGGFAPPVHSGPDVPWCGSTLFPECS
jgi:hypothetical protein